MEGVEVLHAHFRVHEYTRHAHESTTVALVDSGAASFVYRGEHVVAPAGSTFVINAGAVHTGRALTDQGYRYRVLYLDQAALTPLLAGEPGLDGPLAFDETIVRDGRVAGLLDRAHRVLTATGTEPLRQQQALLEVCHALRERFRGRARAGRVAVDDVGREVDHHHRAVALVRDYLEAHATDKVLLQDLATLTGVSAYRLVRIFSGTVGMPPHAYQNQVRIRRARRLLALGIPAANVATLVGFCDQPHLIRMFKKYTGVTPAQFVAGVRCG
ncbi:AraC-like DNA-binding protein [Micromonospora sagamiensis]|uniref:AraC-like DNA-binding protein n=1 Tax=Micromonospora sagamiensis TaxID=47875 RepID=A0A562WHT4_9ACTN|nr:AraC-like DNA-binding protein [Micromonospora sagamiensis]